MYGACWEQNKLPAGILPFADEILAYADVSSSALGIVLMLFSTCITRSEDGSWSFCLVSWVYPTIISGMRSPAKAMFSPTLRIAVSRYIIRYRRKRDRRHIIFFPITLIMGRQLSSHLSRLPVCKCWDRMESGDMSRTRKITWSAISEM